MIEIVKTGICEGCPFVDLDAITLYSPVGPICQKFRCKHEQLCERLERRIREELEAKETARLEELGE